MSEQRDVWFYALVKGGEVVATFDTLEEAVPEWGKLSLRAVVRLTDDEYERANQLAREPSRV